MQRLVDFGRVMDIGLPHERTIRATIADFVIPATRDIYDTHMKEVEEIVKNVNVSKPSFCSTHSLVSLPSLSIPHTLLSLFPLSQFHTLSANKLY